MINGKNKLAYLLRHSSLPSKKGGWVAISEIVPCYMQQEQFNVEIQDTKRFTVSDDGQSIRANYGHTIEIDLGIDVCVPPSVLYHGTKASNLCSILSEGIKSKSRDYVHLTDNINNALMVAKRHTHTQGETIIIKINAERMHADGYLFYNAANQMFITKFVPAEYMIGCVND